MNKTQAPINRLEYKGYVIHTQGSHGIRGGAYKGWVSKSKGFESPVEIVPGSPDQSTAIDFCKRWVDKQG